MELKEYKKIVRKRHQRVSLVEAALGLTSEAGEVAQIIRKAEYETQGINPGRLALELGDVLHYLVQACDYLEITLEDLAELNAAKMNALDKAQRDNFETVIALWHWPGETMQQVVAEARTMLGGVAR